MSDSKPKILVVEDEDFLRKMYQVGLEKEGLEVVTASDGEQALEVCGREEPDLILLDLVLPKKTGFEVLATLKEDEHTKDIPVVVLSGLAQKKDVHSALEAGAEDYFIKTEQTVKDIAENIKKVLRGDS